MHVGIVNPNPKRKQFLENTISIIQLLKGHERLRQLRRDKESAKVELKAKLKGLNKLIKEFNLCIPKVKLLAVKNVKEIKEEAKKEFIGKLNEPKIPKIVKKTDSSNLDRLERDIDLLRKKLEGL